MCELFKGKQSNKFNWDTHRSLKLLEIIHTYILCLDMDACSVTYFITFIDGYLRYMYLYLLHFKDEVFDVFNIFKAEEEKQWGKQIKIMRSDIGGEYYDMYTKNGQALNPFAKFLQDHGIVAY